jgi:phosphoribosyl-dephospho-CoA transferase
MQTPAMQSRAPWHLARHSLVWLTEKGWQSVCGYITEHPVAICDAIARWQAANWPLVVRRSEQELSAGRVAVGIALPPQSDAKLKSRVSAVVDQSDIARWQPPLTLASILTTVPTHWRGPLVALHMESLETLPPLEVFGSLTWAAITTMPYLHSASDIDLILKPSTHSQLKQGTEMLARYAMTLPLDGEIIFPDGRAVAWKEWHKACSSNHASTNTTTQVLVKHLDGVSIVNCQTLLETLDVQHEHECR